MHPWFIYSFIHYFTHINCKIDSYKFLKAESWKWKGENEALNHQIVVKQATVLLGQFTHRNTTKNIIFGKVIFHKDNRKRIDRAKKQQNRVGIS